MGQKSNTTTLRGTNRPLNLYLSNPKLFTKLTMFLDRLNDLLTTKNILVLDKTLNIVNNSCYISLELFYKSIKTASYKKKYINLIYKKNIRSKLLSIFSALNQSIFIITLKNMNKQVNKAVLSFIYSKLKMFISTIFSRRFNLFIDFLKLTSLLVEKKIDANQYIRILANVFKLLPKQSHTRYLFFLKYTFKVLTSDQLDNRVKGIKFVIQGKLQGKPRSTVYSIKEGSVSVQKLTQDISFSRAHAYTLLGAFGLRIWISR